MKTLITLSRIESLKIQIQNYPISFKKKEDEAIMEMIEEHYEGNKEEGPEFSDAIAMIFDEISQAPDEYDFGANDLLRFIIRYFG